MGGAPLARSLACSLAAAMLAPAAADAANPQRLREVARTPTVPAMGTVAMTLACPRAYKSVSGAVRGATRSFTLRSAPVGQRRWNFTLSNTGSAPEQVRLAVICLRLRPPRRARTRLSLPTRRADVDVPPGGTASRTVRCPSGSAPVGYGAEVISATARSGARAAGIGTVGNAAIQKAKPVRGAWEFTLRDFGRVPLRVRLHARCLPRRVRARRVRRARRSATAAQRATVFVIRLVIVRRTFLQPIRFGQNDGIRHSCPSRHWAARDGWEMEEQFFEQVFIAGAWAEVGGDGVWNVLSNAPGEIQMPLYLLCGDLRERWRRD